MIIELFDDHTGIIHGIDGIKVSTNPETIGDLIIDTNRIHVDGLTYLNLTVSGNKPCVFVANGVAYDCDMVNVENGKLKPVHRTSNHTIALKRDLEDQKKIVQDLINRVESIEARMNYKGLDFLKKG